MIDQLCADNYIIQNHTVENENTNSMHDRASNATVSPSSVPPLKEVRRESHCAFLTTPYGKRRPRSVLDGGGSLKNSMKIIDFDENSVTFMKPSDTYLWNSLKSAINISIALQRNFRFSFIFVKILYAFRILNSGKGNSAATLFFSSTNQRRAPATQTTRDTTSPEKIKRSFNSRCDVGNTQRIIEIRPKFETS